MNNVYWGRSQYMLVYCDKDTPPKKGGGPVILLQNYSHPLSQRAEALITSPLPLTLEPPEHDHHLPSYFFPLNKKETQNCNEFKV